jgi:UDP-glucose 4-epimerase
MTGMIVLVTGVTRFLGSSLAGQLAAHPQVERVIGVDAALPEPSARARMFGADFARADIRNPLIARIIEAAGVDTVVHASASATPASSAARTMVKEMNVLGTMQLLAACQRSSSVKHLLVRSSAAVYGGSSRDPAIFTENTPPRAVPSRGPARDAVDIEGYVRGFGRRRPDVRIAVPRFAEIVGPTVQTPLTRYFSLSPTVPVIAGRNARLQLVHERDAVDCLMHLTLGDFEGVVNVAGSGALTLIQAIHRAGRIPLPLPSMALGTMGRLLRTVRVGGFSPEQVHLLTPGRVLDTTRLREQAGFTPAYTTVAAFDDFAARLRPAVSPQNIRSLERRVGALAGIRTAAPEDVPVPHPGSRPRLVGIDGAAGAPKRPRRRQR